jgi:hypothetical protein
MPLEAYLFLTSLMYVSIYVPLAVPINVLQSLPRIASLSAETQFLEHVCRDKAL